MVYTFKEWYYLIKNTLSFESEKRLKEKTMEEGYWNKLTHRTRRYRKST